MRKGRQAFALVLTVILLGLLVLIALALSSLVRSNSELASTALYATQARHHALLGMRTGFGEVQRLLGDSSTESNVTAMGGIGGATYGISTFRHWVGVWDSSGQRLAWLASGADQVSVSPTLLSGRTQVTLVGDNSVGAAGSQSATEDREQVVVGREPIAISTSFPAQTNVEVGGYAFWVGDEGVKISLSSRAGLAAAPAFSPDPLFPSSKPPLAANLPRVLVFDQVKFVPTTTLTATQRQNLFHVLTVRHTRLGSSGELDGTVNINTTSSAVWQQILTAYNTTKAATDPAISSVSASANRIRNSIATATTASKAAQGPFRSVADLGSGTFLATALGDTATNKPSTRFLAVLGSALTVRSETFRIRAYGDAVNPATGTVEARAYCEAVIQRRDFPLPVGRRFVVISFRWLVPEDI